MEFRISIDERQDFFSSPNRITHAIGTINHHHYDDFIIQNGKNEILKKSVASNIADKRAFRNAGI